MGGGGWGVVGLYLSLKELDLLRAKPAYISQGGVRGLGSSIIRIFLVWEPWGVEGVKGAWFVISH